MEQSMIVENAIRYLKENKVIQSDVTLESISIGASGAKLYIIKEKDSRGSREYVLKLYHPTFHEDDSYMETYRKEYRFYQYAKEINLPNIPKILHLEEHGDHGIILIMERLSMVPYEAWTEEKQKEAIALCANVHSLAKDDFACIGLQESDGTLDSSIVDHGYNAWLSVIGEHPGRFDSTLLEEIYTNIASIASIAQGGTNYLCHGDFHPENILTDGNQLYLCDWQGINFGKGIGDLAFFISRGKGMNISMNEESLMEHYHQALTKCGHDISKETLMIEKNASTIVTTFLFWANYLKNSTYERVSTQYNDMLECYRSIRDYIKNNEE